MELAIINGTYRDPSAKLGGQPGGAVGLSAGNIAGGNIGVGGGKGADLLSICKLFFSFSLPLDSFLFSFPSHIFQEFLDSPSIISSKTPTYAYSLCISLFFYLTSPQHIQRHISMIHAPSLPLSLSLSLSLVRTPYIPTNRRNNFTVMGLRTSTCTNEDLI